MTNQSLPNKLNGDTIPSLQQYGTMIGGLSPTSTFIPAAVDASGNLLVSTATGAVVDVNIVEADGMAINVTAGDIDIHTSHTGANPDSMQVGDGTNILDVTALNNSLATAWLELQGADDLVATYTFLDAGTADERVSTIVYTSATLGTSATETYVWSGASPNYYLSTITRS